ncbi:thiaminase II [Rhodopila sp.]|uniref:thiaminase II n=1 Tax=Rhodopila sp. TaxID=2480087 RepID=UPI003D12A59B
MTGFCDQAWQRTTALRSAIHALPFNRELAAGTLCQDRFRFYIAQDALYLEQYARILALAGARGPDGATLQLFARSALEAVTVEQALHGDYFAHFTIDPTRIEPTPDCLAYTSFLLATAYQEPWEVLLAALLPCFWIYWDVGNTISREAAADNPYRAWIDTYSDEAFGKAVGAVIAATDRAAETATPNVQDKMIQAFIRSSQFEWLFWDGAYRMREWPFSS